MSKIFVGGLPPNSSEEEIKEIFEPFGPISRCDLKGGFCFIEFQDERDADDVLKKADEFTLGGNNLKVERSRGGDRGGGDRGGGRGGGNGGDKGCFKCGKPGHFARNCEEGGDDNYRGRGGGGRGRGRGRGGDRGGRRDGGGRGRGGGRGGDRGGRRGGGRGRRDED